MEKDTPQSDPKTPLYDPNSRSHEGNDRGGRGGRGRGRGIGMREHRGGYNREEFNKNQNKNYFQQKYYNEKGNGNLPPPNFNQLNQFGEQINTSTKNSQPDQTQFTNENDGQDSMQQIPSQEELKQMQYHICRNLGACKFKNFCIPEEYQPITSQTLQEQIEYYFSDKNLIKDDFFRQHISSNPEGFVSVMTFLGCPRVQQRGITESIEIQEVVKISKFLELSDDMTMVRRKNNTPLPQRSYCYTKIHPEFLLNPKIKMCQFYFENKCNKNQHCKFQHLDMRGMWNFLSEQERDKLQSLIQKKDSSQKVKEEEKKGQQELNEEQSQKVMKECHFYQTTGCNNGSNCKQTHNGIERLGICLTESCILCEKHFQITGINFLSDDIQNLLLREQNIIFQTIESQKKKFREELKNSEELKLQEIKEKFQNEYDSRFAKYKQFKTEVGEIIGLHVNKIKKESLICVEIKKYQQALPAYLTRKSILSTLNNQENPFKLLIGHTGSGKSTQGPQFLLLDLIKRQKKGLIYCVQPRKIAAKTLALRVQKEMGDLGFLVGYSFGKQNQSSEVTEKKAQLIFTSEGHFIKKLIYWRKELIEGKQNCSLNYVHTIFLDEVHERSFQIDIITGCLKSLQEESKLPKQLNIFVCSATVNREKFQGFFNQCPVIEIEGKNKPIIEVYRPIQNRDVEESKILDILSEIFFQKQQGSNLPLNGHILIFQDSIASIISLTTKIEDMIYQNESINNEDYVVLPLHGKLEQEEQENVFKEHPKLQQEKEEFEDGIGSDFAQYEESKEQNSEGNQVIVGNKTKIIVSTNIAESSVTINGVTVVIDPGFAKETFYDPQRKMTLLQTVPISKAQATQRRGRAGRTAEGICYRLYSEEEFDEMKEDREPDVMRTNSETVILKILGLGIQIEDFQMLDKLKSEVIEQGKKMLRDLEAIDAQSRLTLKGEVMTLFPTEPLVTNVIMQAYRRDCVEEILKINALAQNSTALFFKGDKKDRMQVNQLVNGLISQTPQTDLSDLIIYLEIFSQFQQINFRDKKKFCFNNNLNLKTLKISESQYKEQKTEIFGKIKYLDQKYKFLFQKDEIQSKDSLPTKVKKCFFSSYFHNYSLTNSRNQLQCGNVRFKADFNSTAHAFLGQRMVKQEFFFLKLNRFETLTVGGALSPITQDLKNDSSVVSPQALQAVIQEKSEQFDEFDPFSIPLSQRDFSTFLKRYLEKLRELRNQFDFIWIYEEGQVNVYAKKAIRKIKNDPNAPQAFQQLKNIILSFKDELEQIKKKEMLVVQLDNSDIRMVFDWQFKVVDILGPKEFVKFSVIGLTQHYSSKDLLQILQVDERMLSKYYSVPNKHVDQKLVLEYFSKKQALNDLKRLEQSTLGGQLLNQKLRCFPQVLNFEKKTKESLFVKFRWALFKSEGSAKIIFENEVDPQRALTQLGSIQFNRIPVQAQIDKKNPKAVYIRNLDHTIDEDDIKHKLKLQEFFGDPIIVVHRKKEKESQKLIQRYNDDFECFLTRTQLVEHINSTIFDLHQTFVTAQFRVQSEKEAKELINWYDGKLGVLGEQKVHVNSHRQIAIYIDREVFKVVKSKYEALCEELRKKHFKKGLGIYLKEPKDKQVRDVTILIVSQDNSVNQVAMNRLNFLFYQGHSIPDIEIIAKKRIEIFERIKQQFKEDALFKVVNRKWKLFTSNAEVEVQIKKMVYQIAKEIFEQIQAQGKTNRKQLSSKNCLVCDGDQDLIVLDCGHIFDQDCMTSFVNVTCKNQLKNGIKCPSGDEGCPKISMDLLKDIFKNSFEQLCQDAMKEQIDLRQDIMGCYTPDCPAWFYYNKQTQHQCSVCGVEWCLKEAEQIKAQKLQPHEPHQEESCKLFVEKNKSQVMMEDLILPDTKIITSSELKAKKDKGELVLRRCPKRSCNNVIEHKEACMHMTCICGQHFCFLCGKACDNGEVYDHLNKIHGGIY